MDKNYNVLTVSKPEITGDWVFVSNDHTRLDLNQFDIDFDVLWERMYTKAKAVIVPCGHCKSHNAISNPTCVQCGAPLGG